MQMLMMIRNFVKSLQLEESLVLLYLVVMHLRVIMHNIYNAAVCCAVLCCAAVSKVNKSESCIMAGPVWGNERGWGSEMNGNQEIFCRQEICYWISRWPKDFDSLLPR